MPLRRIVLLAAVAAATTLPAGAEAAKPAPKPPPPPPASPFAGSITNYVDPLQQTALSFGDRSHWLQPWRAYMDTVPATTLLNAVGAVFNVSGADRGPTAQLLAANGFRRARIEIPWGAMSYDDPSKLAGTAEIDATLQALKDARLRPLILLNANHGAPTPSKGYTATTVAPAAAGDTRLQLDAASAAAVVPGRTGLNGLVARDYPRVADVLITAVDDAHVATLSAPLPAALAAGDHPGVTLRFAPFQRPRLDGAPNPAFEETLRGWLDYAKAVTAEAKRVLGSDAFDVEVWNELSFGSDFLDSANYYEPDLPGSGDIDREILARTVSALRDPANGVPNVGITDGFAAQSPFPAGSTSPPGLTALSKHPYLYSGIRHFAPDLTWQTQDETRPLDAQGNVDGTPSAGRWTEGFTPTYDSLLPEYDLWATHKVQRYPFFAGRPAFSMPVDNLVRDLSPITTTTPDGVAHGRGTGPAQTWITEMNVYPGQGGLSDDDEAARLHFQAKTTLRTLTSYVNKGVTAIDFYAARDAQFSLVSNGFFTGGGSGGEVMDAVRRLTTAFSGGSTITAPRSLSLLRIDDYEGHKQFDGDGTAAHPPLFNRDVLAFLPFQLSDRAFVVPVYVMTANVAKDYGGGAGTDMPAERYRLTIGGLNTANKRFAVSATDPLTGAPVAVTVVSEARDRIVVELPVTDSPRLLRISET